MAASTLTAGSMSPLAPDAGQTVCEVVVNIGRGQKPPGSPASDAIAA